MKPVVYYRLLAVLIPLILLGGLRCLLPESSENCTDVYWHIHAADRPFSEMTAKTYPITLSIWRDNFADKEFLFHVLLKAYTGTKRLLGQPLAPPFTGVSIMLLLLFFASFVYAAVKAGIPDKMLWICSLGAGLFTPLFSYRLLMIRPHVLSMSLMMLACGFLFQGPGKWKTVLLIFGMGWLFAWSYSTPHLLIITAIFFAISYTPEEKFRAWLPVPAAALGIFCGLLIHPQSPNTFLLWKLQGIDALLTPTAGLGDGLIPIAKELHPPQTFWLIRALPVLALLYFTIMMWNRLRELNGWKKIRPECTVCTLAAFMWMGAACMISIRPIEYAVPMLFLALGTLIPQGIAQNAFRGHFRMETLPRIILIVTICSAVFSGCYLSKTLRDAPYPAPRQMAEVLKKIAKPGDRIINLDWSDFPPFAFLAPEFEYTWGIDPMFSFTPFPKECRYLGRLSRPAVHSSRQLRKRFHAKYAVLLRRQYILGKNLQENCGWKTVYAGPEGWIFKLEE